MLPVRALASGANCVRHNQRPPRYHRYQNIVPSLSVAQKKPVAYTEKGNEDPKYFFIQDERLQQRDLAVISVHLLSSFRVLLDRTRYCSESHTARSN